MSRMRLSTTVVLGMVMACGSPGEPTRSVATLEMSPALDTLTSVGAEARLVAVARAADGTHLGGLTITWTSGAPAAATVDSSGRVTAVANGETTITATVQGVQASARIVVAQVVTTIQVTTAADTVRAVGDTTRYHATAHDARGHLVGGIAFIWFSSDTTVATVEPSGLVTAMGNGSARVVVWRRSPDDSSVIGPSGTAPIVVYLPVASVTVSPDTLTVVIGTTVGLTATLRAGTGQELLGRSVSWTSTNERVAVVNSAGRVAGADEGDVVIVAASDGVEGAAAITVKVLAFGMVTAGELHTCGLTTDGEAYCWGAGHLAQLGTSVALGPCTEWTTTSCSTAPIAVAGGVRFVALDAGQYHTCGLTASGEAYCWGFNAAGELGATLTRTTLCGPPTGPCATQPEPVMGGLAFTAISAGGEHTCGLTVAGKAYCWGSNASGQLGDSTTTSRATPVPVAGGLTFASISAGRNHTCGVLGSGEAFCWGLNTQGRLGDSTYVQKSYPVSVAGAHAFQSVTAGATDYTCGVTTGGDAYCWGCNVDGKLGAGPNATLRTDCNHAECIWTPIAVTGSYSWSSAIPASYHTCGIAADGSAYCWGANFVGQLGNGTTAGSQFSPVPHPSPVAVVGGLAFWSLSPGLAHTCAITTGGVSYCWGLNDMGQAAAGPSFWALAPAKVPGQR